MLSVRRAMETTARKYRRAQRAALEAQHGDGCVYAAKNRKTGVTIQIYKPFTQSGEPGWMVVCREHGSCMLVDTRHQAERSMAIPEWCDECQDIMEKKS